MSNPSSKLRIFYDGGCKVCAWEVRKYIAMDTRGALGTIDILAPDFDAEAYGLNQKKVRKFFHVITPDGKVIAGVDAFIAIWKALDKPFTRTAARLAAFPPIHFLLRIGYGVFVEIRPYLPRNAVACDDGSCDLK